MKTNINSGSDHVEDCVSEKVKEIIYAEREIEKERAREDEEMKEMDMEERYEYELIDVNACGSGGMSRCMGAAIEDLTEDELKELRRFI